MVLVHHGLFWRNEPLVVDRRLRGRLEALFRANASLVAYHLALDAHADARERGAAGGADRRARRGAVRRRRARLLLDGISIGELTARVQRRRRPRAARLPARARADRAPRRLDRRRRVRPDPGRTRGLRRAPHRRARGAEPRDGAGARDPPARGRPSRDRAVRRPGARRTPRRHVRDRVALPRGREPRLTSALGAARLLRMCEEDGARLPTVGCPEYPGSIMVHFGRRAR